MEENDFEALMTKYKTIVERYINYRMPDSCDADDVIQETYIAAYRHFGELKNPDLFKSWILSIAKNQCSLWYRKNRRAKIISLEDAENELKTPEPVYDDSLSVILHSIPEDSVKILRMTADGYRQKEIADILNIPIGTVKSRLHYAKKQFLSICPPEIKLYYERGNIMSKNDYTGKFPTDMPNLTLTKKDVPFFEVKFEEESFIIPRVGEKNSEGTYRYPAKKLALVSTCYVPKKAIVHEVEGVKICRDTYNVNAGKLYKNERIWFSQLTEEYLRDLGTIADGDDDFPTYITTFLDEDYDICVNGNDRVHGKPLLIKENPPKIDSGGIHADEYNIRYTMGVYDVSIGGRTFETIKFILPQRNSVVTENFVDKNGRLVLMRWYESEDSVRENENYNEKFIELIQNNPTITVNNIKYILIEDRISEYAI